MTEKILVVDDDMDVLGLMSSALERAGYQTFSELHSLRALQTIRTHSIPVVVSDIMMPEMDGLTLLHRIKEQNPDTVVIFVTAHAQLDSAISAIKEGAFAYLRKPFDPAELVNTVKNAFVKVRLFEQNTKFVEELRSARDYSEMILKNLTYTVIITDLEGKIKKVNHATEKLLGYNESELLSKSISEIFSREFLATGWQELLKNQKVNGLPVPLKKKDGSVISLQFTGKVMRDASGEAVGFLGTAEAK